MTPADFEQAAIVLAIWREARAEGLDVMCAIAQVLRNRSIAKKISYADVLTDLDTPEDLAYPDPRDPLFTRLLPLIAEIHAGRAKDPTCGAQHQCRLAASAAWFEYVAANPGLHPCVAKVGARHFFL